MTVAENRHIDLGFSICQGSNQGKCDWRLHFKNKGKGRKTPLTEPWGKVLRRALSELKMEGFIITATQVRL